MELVVIVAVTLGVIGLAGRLPEARQVKRDLARRRLDAIGSLADGKVVTLRGEVAVADGELVAPVSGRRCVYVRQTAELRGRVIERREQSVPFELVVDGERVRVVASAPRLGVPEHVKAGPDGRMVEQVIPVGATITLRGLCTFEPDPTRDDVDGLYRGGERPVRPVISGTRRVKLLIG